MKTTVTLPEGVSGRLDRALADTLGLGRAAVKRAFAWARCGWGGAGSGPPARPGPARWSS